MKYIFGLGNPGAEYVNTRHNVGFRVIDFLAEKNDLQFKCHKKTNVMLARSSKLTLAKPMTYMNESGAAVRAVIDYFSNGQSFSGENLFVVHDDLDLDLGKFKIQFAKGPKTHNGLLSIYQTLSSNKFWHVRFGVDNRNGDRLLLPENFVLKVLTDQENQQIDHGVLSLANQLTTMLS